MLSNARAFWFDLRELVRPYWISEERWIARGLLAVVIAFDLGTVFVSVQINQWQAAFFNALEQKDQAEFMLLLGRFALLAIAYIVMAVYQLYLTQMLQIRWRRWLTDRYLDAWLGNRTYYRMQLENRPTDNPDQRIAEDLNLFVADTLTLGLGALNAVVTLASFLVILWGLSGALTLSLGSAQIVVPGYLVWAALAYAGLGTWAAHAIGRPLIGLNFSRQRVEADFRFALVRVRENAEPIALYGGERDEKRSFLQRFAAIADNWWQIMRRQKKLTWFQSFYGQVAVIFPYVMVAPRYFSGAITLGPLMQTAAAFGQVQTALSWIVDAYARLADWKATTDRLTGFRAAMEHERADAKWHPGVVRVAEARTDLRAEQLRLQLPDGRVLLEVPRLDLQPGQATLISGASGAGKSTLLRALAGIWPFGDGQVHVPADARALFLPQRPYLPLGSLRSVLSYPASAGAFDDAQLRRWLEAVDLEPLAARLDEEQNWALVLSGGEQQRIAFARALLHRPDWLFLDEATSALDEPLESRMYQLLREELPATTLVSIAHRPGLREWHTRALVVGSKEGKGRLTEAATPALTGTEEGALPLA